MYAHPDEHSSRDLLLEIHICICLLQRAEQAVRGFIGDAMRGQQYRYPDAAATDAQSVVLLQDHGGFYCAHDRVPS